MQAIDFTKSLVEKELEDKKFQDLLANSRETDPFKRYKFFVWTYLPNILGLIKSAMEKVSQDNFELLKDYVATVFHAPQGIEGRLLAHLNNIDPSHAKGYLEAGAKNFLKFDKEVREINFKWGSDQKASSTNISQKMKRMLRLSLANLKGSIRNYENEVKRNP